MSRPGYWQANDGALLLTTTNPASQILVGNPTPPNRTLVRVIGDVTVYAERPPSGIPDLGFLCGVHLLGAGADLGAGNVNAFPDAWLFWKRLSLNKRHWSPQDGRYRDSFSFHFDVEGMRKFTASRPTARLAFQLRETPEPTGQVVVQFSGHTRVLFEPGVTAFQAADPEIASEIVDDSDLPDDPIEAIYPEPLSP